MNYIQHLTSFFEVADSDNRLTSHHLTLYLAFFRMWNLSAFQNPISIARAETMRLAKIGSTHTYVRCINDLHNWNYIRYHPSFNPQKGSLVDLCILNTASGTANAQVVHSSTNNTLIKKTSHSVGDLFGPNNEANITANYKPVKASNAVNHPLPVSTSPIPPPLNRVTEYFAEKGFTNTEAEKFFNYFQSNGWLVGGKAKMKDWKAAARNWMGNVQKFAAHTKTKPVTAPKLDSSKRYDIPL